MINLEIYCTTIEYFSILDKLPSYIKPLGLGNTEYPKHWLTDKKGENISNLNKYYTDATGLYWVWKHVLKNKDANDWIGTCHYRKLWLNNIYNEKQKLSVKSLYSNLLRPDNKIFSDCDVIQVQPIVFKNETVYEQFNKVHKNNALRDCTNFLEADLREEFKEYLNGNILHPHSMFITKAHLLNRYCEILFPWMEKCHTYCMEKKLIKDYNIRLTAFMMERFNSFWFSKNIKKRQLSYARLGKFMLSNNINKYINPMKIPFTFRMHPTLHDF